MSKIITKFIIGLINFYQKYLSRDTGFFKSKTPTCLFYPTCSEYTKQALQKYGLFKGLFLGFKRISRCHPWHKGNNFDPLA
jgi:putative membrane protein insertion efficiency factor